MISAREARELSKAGKCKALKEEIKDVLCKIEEACDFGYTYFYLNSGYVLLQETQSFLVGLGYSVKVVNVANMHCYKVSWVLEDE